MTTDPHTEFLQDPEGHASHFESCAQCRAILETLNADAPTAGAVKIDKLPLASWEGAGYKSWPFVAVASAIVAVAAIILCHFAGVSPLHAVESDASIAQWRTLLNILTSTLSRASLGWQIVFGGAFVVVNTVLYLLLRRPPRGIDA